MKIEKIIKVARRKRLDGIAITDHNSFNNSIMASKIRSSDFFIISGSEIATDKGEILGLFLTEAVKSRDLLGVIDEIRDQDGISVIPHPYKRSLQVDNNLLNSVDGIEVFNARASLLQNKKAQELSSGKRRLITAGSDAHFYFEIGRGTTTVKMASNLEEIRKNLLSEKTILNGVISSPYVETISQIVRFSKTRNPRILFKNVMVNTAIFTYKFILRRR